MSPEADKDHPVIDNVLYQAVDYGKVNAWRSSTASGTLIAGGKSEKNYTEQRNIGCVRGNVGVSSDPYEEIEEMRNYSLQRRNGEEDTYEGVNEFTSAGISAPVLPTELNPSPASHLYCDIDSLDQQDVANNNELSSITNRMSLQERASTEQGQQAQRPHSLNLKNETQGGGGVLSSPVKERPSSVDAKTFSRSLSSQRFSPAKLSHVNYEDILDIIHRNAQLDAKEKERQSSIYELISTEQSYVKVGFH